MTAYCILAFVAGYLIGNLITSLKCKKELQEFKKDLCVFGNEKISSYFMKNFQ